MELHGVRLGQLGHHDRRPCPIPAHDMHTLTLLADDIRHVHSTGHAEGDKDYWRDYASREDAA